MSDMSLLLDERPAVVNRFTSDEPLEACWHCHTPRRHGDPWAFRGLCGTCYKRWHDHGFPASGVPEQRTTEGWLVNDRDIMSDFARLDHPEIPGRTAELCRRFNVSRRTIYRWRGRLREERRRAHLLAISAEVCGRTRWRSRLRPGAIAGREISPYVAGTSPVAAMVAAQVLDQTASSVARPAYFRA